MHIYAKFNVASPHKCHPRLAFCPKCLISSSLWGAHSPGSVLGVTSLRKSNRSQLFSEMHVPGAWREVVVDLRKSGW